MTIADRVRRCSTLGEGRYQLETAVQRRLRQTFGAAASLPLNQKAEAWWQPSLLALGDALKQSFKLPSNPLKHPRTADEWDPYLDEKRAAHQRLTRALADTEAELSARVYHLFALTPAEIALLQKEVEH